MKPFVLITLLGLASLGLGCNTPRSTADADLAADTAATLPAPTDPTACRPLRREEPGKGHPISSLEAHLDGTCLAMTVRHGGGCGTHDYQLHWNGTIQDSYPQQVHLRLVHGGKPDPCEAMLTQELRFDLAPILGSQSSPFKIGISAEGVPGTSLAYTPK